MTRHVTVELTEDQAALLDTEAAREARPVEAIVADLIQRQVDYEMRFRSAVEEGLAAVRRGDTLSHEEVVARSRRRAADLLGDLKAQ
jgi:predicted transcriptional regulator